MRSDWTALPESVTAAIAERVGGTFDVAQASSGDHAEIASTVRGPAGPIFIKAASGELSVRSLRYEVAVTRADRHPPAVLWQFESDGWLVVGTEHLAGPHPDLSPGSTDLNLLLAALKALQETPAPGETWFTPATRLGFAHPAMDGETLIHTDLNPANLIVTPLGLPIVDWAWATKAAAWVELALLVPWLIGSGHSAEQAEEWIAQLPAWTATDRQVLNDFASKNATKWAAKSRQNTERWVRDLAMWTGEWAHHRTDGHQPAREPQRGGTLSLMWAPATVKLLNQPAGPLGTANQFTQPGRSMAARTENQPRCSQSAPNVSHTYRKARYRQLR